MFSWDSAFWTALRTKSGEKCWTCAPVGEGRAMGMDSGHGGREILIQDLRVLQDFPQHVMWPPVARLRSFVMFLNVFFSVKAVVVQCYACCSSAH